MAEPREVKADEKFLITAPKTVRNLKLLSKFDIQSRRNATEEWKKIDFKYSFNNVDNFSLAFHRLIPESKIDEKDKDSDTKKYLEALVNLVNSLPDDAVNGMKDRMHKMLESYRNQGWFTTDSEQIVFSTDWRMIVGLGAKGPLEIGLTLHHLYGFPYIPASSLKGLARGCALLTASDSVDVHFIENAVEIEKVRWEKLLLPENSAELKEVLQYKNNKGEPVPISEEEVRKIVEIKEELNDIRDVFGNQHQAGRVTFFDGLPNNFPKLEVDIINPHYQEYYSSGQMPGDWMQPVPSFFLAVAPGQPFNFFLASRNKILLDKAKQWLLYGLTEMGIGGKTSAGYGYFIKQKHPSGQDIPEAEPDIAKELATKFKVSKHKKG